MRGLLHQEAEADHAAFYSVTAVYPAPKTECCLQVRLKFVVKGAAVWRRAQKKRK